MKLYIKYMVSTRCKMAVREALKKLGLHFVIVDLGLVDVMEDITINQREQIGMALLKSGLELMDDKNALLIDAIKKLIIEKIHHTDELHKVNFSGYLSEKLNHDYAHMANLFSELQGITIEQFIIINKIEWVKELIIYDELSLTEIAWKMQYSSVAHLSNQFKKISGLSPSHFKKLKQERQKVIDDISDC